MPLLNWAKRQVSLLLEAYDRWTQDDGWLMASAVAYYASLSFFPIVLLGITVMGRFFEVSQRGEDAERVVIEVIEDQVSPGVGSQVQAILGQVTEDATINGPVALGTLLFTAVAIFAQFDIAFDRIWGVHDDRTLGLLASIRYVLVVRLVAFLMLLGLGLLIVVIFAVGLVIQALRERLPLPGSFWIAVNFTTPLLLNLLTFSIVYRVLPKVRVTWKEAFRGACLAAFMWEVGRWLLAAFLIGDRYETSYAIVGSFIAIMLWVYYAVAVLFFGAEYIQSFCRHCRRLEPEQLDDGEVTIDQAAIARKERAIAQAGHERE